MFFPVLLSSFSFVSVSLDVFIVHLFSVILINSISDVSPKTPLEKKKKRKETNVVDIQ